MSLMCVSCKGKNPSLCGRDFCPIYTKAESMFKVVDKIGKDFSGNSPPSVFVGSKTYPNVNVGILSPLQDKEESSKYESPYLWKKENYPIKKIVEMRSSLINSRFSSNVISVRNKNSLLDLGKEVAMSMKPASIEFSLKKKPFTDLNLHSVTMPMGPSAPLIKAKAQENIKIPKEVDRVYDDTDLKALGAINHLVSKGYNENQLTQLLSVGVLGRKKDRRLVPTRFSITAVDDNLGKESLKSIKNFESVDKFEMYVGNYLGNYFFVLVMPGVFSYELFEMYLPKSLWNPEETIQVTTDYETYFGRKTYASNCQGGYYAARLPIIERFNNLRRQGSALVFRFTTPEYSVPLGVWVVREAVRNAMKSEPLIFESKKDLLDNVKKLVFDRFNFNLSNLISKSKLLTEINKQSSLKDYF
jgi:DNA repair protein NreA